LRGAFADINIRKGWSVYYWFQSMDITCLNDYSREAAEEIFRRFPEWTAFATAESDPTEDNYLVIEVPPPEEAAADHPLTITTSNNEVTVGFDNSHSHFGGWWSDKHASYVVNEAMPFIASLLAESLAAVSWWLGDDWRGSMFVTGGQSPERSEFQSDASRVRIRSWRGTHNADYTV
jgi:hypothetical protein